MNLKQIYLEMKKVLKAGGWDEDSDLGSLEIDLTAAASDDILANTEILVDVKKRVHLRLRDEKTDE